MVNLVFPLLDSIKNWFANVVVRGLLSGGDLVLHIVNKTYCIEYQQGDMLTFRSAIVMHEIMVSTG
jgi:hypothetical protein